jgi:tetratricopeptide (TPR) repeat protein
VSRLATILALTLLASSAASAIETIPRQELEHLRALVTSGQCDRAGVGIRTLRDRYPDDPDLFVLEANCVLAEGKRNETRFVPEAYQALRLRANNETLPATTAGGLYETRVTYPDDVMIRAHGLLDEALRRAPFRRDLHLGKCYLHQATERHEELLEAIALTATRVPGEQTNMALLTYVDVYIGRGEADRAVAVAEKIAEHFGENARTWAYVGRTRALAGDLDGARRAYAQARSQDVNDSQIAMAAADVEMLARSFAEAEAILLELLLREPDAHPARFKIAWCQARPRPLEAVNHLQRLLKESQGRGGVMHKAAVRLREMLSKAEDPPVEEWHALGVRLAEGRFLPSAIAAWDYALHLDPTHRATLETVGELYSGLGFGDRAREAYRQAKALAPPRPGEEGLTPGQLDARIGWSYLVSGQYEEALEVYLATDDPVAHALQVASIHQSRGDLAEARRWLEKASGRPALADEARRRLLALGREETESEAEDSGGAAKTVDGEP